MPIKDPIARAEYNRRKYLLDRDARLAKQRKYNKENRLGIAAKMREHRSSNPELAAATGAKYRESHAVQLKNAKRQRWYGLSPEAYTELFKKQGSCCAVCKSKTTRARRDWHIDHCHKTGKVRGILCHRCNVGLGHFDDSVESLRAAVKYLLQYGEE